MNEIEKKIYQAGQVQRLNKTSDDILDAYKKKHHHRVQKKFIFIPALTTLATAAVATALVFIFKPVAIHLDGQTKGFDDGSSVLTSLASDLSIHYYVQPTNGVQSSILRSAISQEEFTQVVSDVDAAYPAYTYYSVHTEGIHYAFDWNNFEYDDVTYHYQLAVNNTMVYLKDNISEKTKGNYEGLIRIDDSCYPCEVVAKIHNNHTYTTFRYRINSYLYTLSHESKEQKTIINYEVRIDEEVALTESVSLKFNNNVFEASFKNNNLLTEVEKERSFKHKTSDNFVNVDYVKKSESKNVHYENIKLTTSNDKSLSRTYSYEGVEDIVI